MALCGMNLCQSLIVKPVQFGKDIFECLISRGDVRLEANLVGDLIRDDVEEHLVEQIFGYVLTIVLLFK